MGNGGEFSVYGGINDLGICSGSCGVAEWECVR